MGNCLVFSFLQKTPGFGIFAVCGVVFARCSMTALHSQIAAYLQGVGIEIYVHAIFATDFFGTPAQKFSHFHRRCRGRYFEHHLAYVFQFYASHGWACRSEHVVAEYGLQLAAQAAGGIVGAVGKAVSYECIYQAAVWGKHEQLAFLHLGFVHGGVVVANHLVYQLRFGLRGL